MTGSKKRASWGGARSGAGRPKKAEDERRGARLVVPCTDDELAAWTATAHKTGKKLAAWARERLGGTP